MPAAPQPFHRVIVRADLVEGDNARLVDIFHSQYSLVENRDAFMRGGQRHVDFRFERWEVARAFRDLFGGRIESPPGRDEWGRS